MSTQGRMVICQISDIHCGSPYFIPDLLERSILEINDLDPTAVVVSGDLTDAGYRQEFEDAAEYVRRIRCERVMVIPGNHDSRNVGYIHFERLFGERYSILDFEEAVMVAVDSSEPDLDDGRVGREHYEFIHETFAMAEDKLKIFVIHHHLIPIPEREGSATSSTMLGMCSSYSPIQRSTSCSRGTSTCLTPGSSKTCSSLTQERPPPPDSGVTRAPATTS